jgi:hypothetical protein
MKRLLAAWFSVSCALAAAPTFNKDVAPILFENCMSCHREGEAAPFPLTNYQEAKKRGQLIAMVTQSRYMPPWHVADEGPEFRDERRLDPKEIAALQEWVKAGMPEGKAADLPEAPKFAEGWQLGEPDLIVEFPEAFEIPADGPDLYRSFAIPLGLDEDKWVRAVEFRPQARGSSHHALFFWDTTGSAVEADEADPKAGFSGMSELSAVWRGRRGRRGDGQQGGGGLGGWAVGGAPRELPAGLARPLPAGADLVVQMHFHPSGKAETEKAKLGLFFVDKPPEKTLTGIQVPPLFGRFSSIDIPAGEKDYVVKDSFTTPIDLDVYGAGGHAHYLCKQMKMTATLPTGETKTILWIDRWDFAWQERYYFADPMRLPAGTKLDVELHYDNSAENPSNPHDPPVRVAWGRGSEDEMGAMSIEATAVNEADLPELREAQRQQMRDAFLTRLKEAPSRMWRRLTQ